METVHIIGGGLSGLSCAVSLIKNKKKKINIYEASGIFGGRCRSYKEKKLNCILDNGNHLIINAYKNTFKYLNEINALDELISNKTTFYPFIEINKLKKWNVRPYSFIFPWWIFFKSCRPLNISFLEFIKSLKIIFAKKNQKVTDIIKKNELIYNRFWKPFTIAVLNTNPNEASARLLSKIILKILFFQNNPLKPFMAKNSLDKTFIKPAIKRIKESGGVLKTNSRLKKIEFQKNQAKKIIFNDKIINLKKNDALVLAVTPNIISKILPYLKTPKKSNCILNIHYKLNSKIKPIKMPNNSFFIGIIGGMIDWIFKKGNVISITISAANKLNNIDDKKISKIIWKEIEKIFDLGKNEIPNHKIIREKMATFVQSPREIYKKPEATTKYKNIFLAGDWIDTGLPATIEGAITSGYNVTNIINKLK